MGASYSNPLVDSDLVFPAPPSSYSEDTPGLLRLRSSFIPSREVPAFLVRPRVRATTSSSRFSSERGAGGGGSSNASTVACRNASEAPSFLSQHSHVTPRGSPSTLPSVLSSSSPSSFSSASPNAVFFRGARPSVRNFLPRARAPSRLPPPSLSSGTSRTAPQRGNGSCPRPDSNNVVSRFLSSGRRSLPSEGCSGNVRRAGTPTSCFSVRGARCGGAGSSGEHKGAAGQRHPSSAGFEATGAAQPTRGGLFLGSEEPAESAAPHWDASGGSSFLGRKGEGETSALECSGGATFLGQQERKKAEKGFCILYFHGNACDANMMRGWLQLLADELKVTILIFEYPGYGLLEDYDKSSRGIDLCARIAFEFLVEKLLFPIERIILCGRSIGTGAAAWLAAQLAQRNVQVGGLVLIAPFVSLAAVAADWADAPLILTRVLVHHHWNTEAAVAQIPSVPLCIIHGKEDDVIPVEHAKRLWAAARQPPSLRVARFADSDHNVGLTLESLQADIVVPLQALLQRISANLRSKHAEKKPGCLRRRGSAEVASGGFHRNLVPLAQQPWVSHYHGHGAGGKTAVSGSAASPAQPVGEEQILVNQCEHVPGPHSLPHQEGQAEEADELAAPHHVSKGQSDSGGEGGKREDGEPAVCLGAGLDGESLRGAKAASSSGGFLYCGSSLSREAPAEDANRTAPSDPRSLPVPGPHHDHQSSGGTSRRLGGGVAAFFSSPLLRRPRQRAGEGSKCTLASLPVHLGLRESGRRGATEALDHQENAACLASASAGPSPPGLPTGALLRKEGPRPGECRKDVHPGGPDSAGFCTSASSRDLFLHVAGRSLSGGSTYRGCRKRFSLGPAAKEGSSLASPSADVLRFQNKAVLPQFLREEVPAVRSTSIASVAPRLRSAARLPFFLRFRSKGSPVSCGREGEGREEDRAQFLDSAGHAGRCGSGGEQKQQARRARRASSSSGEASRTEVESERRSRRGSWTAGEREKSEVSPRFQRVGSGRPKDGAGLTDRERSGRWKMSFFGSARGEAPGRRCEALPSADSLGGLQRRTRRLGGAVKMRLEDHETGGLGGKSDREEEADEGDEEEGEGGGGGGEEEARVMQDAREDRRESGQPLDGRDCEAVGEEEVQDLPLRYYCLGQSDAYGEEALGFDEHEEEEDEDAQDLYIPSEPPCAPHCLSALLFEGADPIADMPRRGEQSERAWGMPAASLLDEEVEAEHHGEVEMKPTTEEPRAEDTRCSSSTTAEMDPSLSSSVRGSTSGCSSSSPTPASPDEPHFFSRHLLCQPSYSTFPPFLTSVPPAEDSRRCSPSAPLFPGRSEHDALAAGRAFLAPDAHRHSTMLAAFLQQETSRALQQRHQTALHASSSSSQHIPLRSLPSRALRVFRSSSVQQGSAFIAGSPLQPAPSCSSSQGATQSPPREKAAGPTRHPSIGEGGSAGAAVGLPSVTSGFAGGGIRVCHPTAQPPCIGAHGLLRQEQTSHIATSCKGGDGNVEPEKRVASASFSPGPQSAAEAVRREDGATWRGGDVPGGRRSHRSRTVAACPPEGTVSRGRRRLSGRRKTSSGPRISHGFQRRDDFLGMAVSQGREVEAARVRKLRPRQFREGGEGGRAGRADGGELTEEDRQNAEPLNNDDNKVGEHSLEAEGMVEDCTGRETCGEKPQPWEQEEELADEGVYYGEEGTHSAKEEETPEHARAGEASITPHVSTPRSSVLTMDTTMDTSETCLTSGTPGAPHRREGEEAARASRFVYRQSVFHEAAPPDSPRSAPSVSFPAPVRSRSRSSCSPPPSPLQATAPHVSGDHLSQPGRRRTAEHPLPSHGHPPSSASQEAGEVLPFLSRSASSFFSPAKLLRNRPSVFPSHRLSCSSRLCSSPRTCLVSSPASYGLHRNCSLPPRSERRSLEEENCCDAGFGCARQDPPKNRHAGNSEVKEVPSKGRGSAGCQVISSSVEQVKLPVLLASSSLPTNLYAPRSVVPSCPQSPAQCSVRQWGQEARLSSGCGLPSPKSRGSCSASYGIDPQTLRDNQFPVFVTDSFKVARCRPSSFPVSPEGPSDVAWTASRPCPSLLQASSRDARCEVSADVSSLSPDDSRALTKGHGSPHCHSSLQLFSPRRPPLLSLARSSAPRVSNPPSSAESRPGEVACAEKASRRSPRGLRSPCAPSYPCVAPAAQQGLEEEPYLVGAAAVSRQCSSDRWFSSRPSSSLPVAACAEDSDGQGGLSSTSVTLPVSVTARDQSGACTSRDPRCPRPDALPPTCSPSAAPSPCRPLPPASFPGPCSPSPSTTPPTCFQPSPPVFPGQLAELLAAAPSSSQVGESGARIVVHMQDLSECAAADKTARGRRAGATFREEPVPLLGSALRPVSALHAPAYSYERAEVKAKKHNIGDREDQANIPKRQTEGREALAFSPTVQSKLAPGRRDAAVHFMAPTSGQENASRSEVWEGRVDENGGWKERLNPRAEAMSGEKGGKSVGCARVREACRLPLEHQEKTEDDHGSSLCGFSKAFLQHSEAPEPFLQDTVISFSSDRKLSRTQKNNSSPEAKTGARGSRGASDTGGGQGRGESVTFDDEKGIDGRADNFSGRPEHPDTGLQPARSLEKAPANKQAARLPRESSSCPVTTPKNEAESSRGSSRTDVTGGPSFVSSVCDSLSSPAFHFSSTGSSPSFPATAAASSPSHSRCSSSSGRCSLPPPFLPPPPSVSSVVAPSFYARREACASASFVTTPSPPVLSVSRLPDPGGQGARASEQIETNCIAEADCGRGSRSRGEARLPAVWLSAPVVSPIPPVLGEFRGGAWPPRSVAAVARLRLSAKAATGRDGENEWKQAGGSDGDAARGGGCEPDSKAVVDGSRSEFSPRYAGSTDGRQDSDGGFSRSRGKKEQQLDGEVEEGGFDSSVQTTLPPTGSRTGCLGALKPKEEEIAQSREIQRPQLPQIFRRDSLPRGGSLAPLSQQQQQQRTRADSSYDRRTEAHGLAETDRTETQERSTETSESHANNVKRKADPVHFIICSDDDVACPPPAENGVRHDGTELLSCTSLTNCRRDHSCCWEGAACSRHRYQITHSDSAYLVAHASAPCSVHPPPPPLHSCSCCTPRFAWPWPGACCRAAPSLVACPSSPPACSSGSSAKSSCRCAGDGSCSLEMPEGGRVPRRRGAKDNDGEYETCTSSSSSFSPCSSHSRSFLSSDPWSCSENEYLAMGKVQSVEGQAVQSKESRSTVSGVPAQGGCALGEADLSGRELSSGGSSSCLSNVSSAKTAPAKSNRTGYSSSSSSIAQKRRVVRHGTALPSGSQSQSQCATQGPNSRNSSSRALSPNRKTSEKPSVFLSSSAARAVPVGATTADSKTVGFPSAPRDKTERPKNSRSGLEAGRGKNTSESCVPPAGQGVELGERRRVNRHISFPFSSRDECVGKAVAADNCLVTEKSKRGEREGWEGLGRVAGTGNVGSMAEQPGERPPRRVPASSFF